MRKVPVSHSTCTGYSVLASWSTAPQSLCCWELQLVSLCIEHGPMQSLLPASQRCLQMRGLLMESSLHTAFGSLPFLPRGLCEAPHQCCLPGGTSSMERGYKSALRYRSLPHPLLSHTLYCSSPSWCCDLVQCENGTINGKTTLICNHSTIFKFGITQK